MKPSINGRANRVIATGFTLATGLILLATVATAAVPPMPPPAAEVQAKVGQRVEQIARGDTDYSKELQYRIQGAFGVTTSCDEGMFSTSTKNRDCVQGLQNLEIALSKLNEDSKRLVREVYVQIGDAGDWGGLTYSDQELVIPYQAPSDVMAQFISKEVNLLNNVSLSDVRKENSERAHEILSKYFIRVSPAPDIQPIVYHDGLERLGFALSTLYVKDQPSAEEAAKLGFDRVILGAHDRNMYEDQGELRIHLDATDSPMEMQIRLISQLAAPKNHWYQHLKFGFGPNTFSGSDYSWNRVVLFRENRRQAREGLEWLQENAPNIHVTCNLNSNDRYSIDMQECAEGVSTIQRTVAQYHLNNRTPAFKNLIVGKMLFSSTVAQKYRDALVMKYNADEKTVYRAILQK